MKVQLILKKVTTIFLSNVLVIKDKKLVKYNLPKSAVVSMSIEHPALEHSMFIFNYIFVFYGNRVTLKTISGYENNH